MTSPLKLNLGCGARKLEGYVNVDKEPLVDPDVVADLGAPGWPFETSSVDEAAAEHVLEHLTAERFMAFMGELHRVCKPGAKVRVVLPHPRHDIFLNDPTHVRPLMPASFFGFSKKHTAWLEKQGIRLTPLWQHLGVDFDLGNTQYWFDPGTDKNDPELEWRMKHLNNIVSQWGMTMTVVK